MRMYSSNQALKLFTIICVTVAVTFCLTTTFLPCRPLSSLLVGPSSAFRQIQWTSPALHGNFRIVDPSTVAWPPAHNDCITAKVDTDGPGGGRSFPICPYPTADDIWVSAATRRGQYFEANHVRLMLQMLRTPKVDDKDKIFVDIGTNIGCYSLAIGHAGYKVISFEPNALTLRYLATGIVRGNLSDHVTLLHNAVSNERTVVRLGVEMTNRGNSFLLPSNSNCTDDANVGAGIKCQTNVRTVTLDDLLQVIRPEDRNRVPTVVIKVDAQGSELKIFDPNTSAEFFRRVNVHAIQIEWVLFASTTLEAHKQEANRVINHFRSLNFTFHPLEGYTTQVLGADWSKWPYDILLIRH